MNLSLMVLSCKGNGDKVVIINEIISNANKESIKSTMKLLEEC